jgi:hypothetical protein
MRSGNITVNELTEAYLKFNIKSGGHASSITTTAVLKCVLDEAIKLKLSILALSETKTVQLINDINKKKLTSVSKNSYFAEYISGPYRDLMHNLLGTQYTPEELQDATKWLGKNQSA